MEQNKDQIGAAVRGEAVAEFNINDMMIVTLTEFGAQIWNSRYDDIPIPAHLIPKPVLAGHVLKDQMWDLMKTFGPHIHLGGEMPFLKAIMAHEKVSARDADAPSEPSELPTQAMYGMQWPEGYVADLNGKITPPKGRVNDFNFGYDNGYADGLQSIKDTVANIGAQAVVKSRAADAPSEPSESLCAAVMNIPCARTMSHFVRVPEMVAYKEGHRDALCAVIDVIAAVKSRAADALDSQPTDATRYQRLRVLGAAPCGSKQLDAGNVLRFQGLDAFIDADLAAHPSRGEASSQPTDGGVRNG